jgi:hypothetical protein
MFFDSLLYDATSEGTKSYNQMAVEVKSTHRVDISGQGIDQRYNQGARKYILELISGQLASQVFRSIDIGWSRHFKRVTILDGTKFDLPGNLKEIFPGFGGSASKAGLCIQYELDIKSGEVIDLSLHSAKISDTKYALQTVDSVQKGDLTIRDLGYFVLDYFKIIQKKGAFFLSRLNTNVQVFDDKLQKLDFAKLYQEMTSSKTKRHDIMVYIGGKDKVPVRLIIELMPDEVLAKRLRKINKENKKKGHRTSEEYKDRARFNLFITNIKQEMLDGDTIANIYRIRWQVELIFKVWKSVFGMDKIRQMKYDRLMCLLGTRLLLILINWEMFMIHRAYQYRQTGKLLSIHKCMQTLKDSSTKLRSLIISDCKNLRKWFKWIEVILSSKHWLEKKKNKLGFEEIMYLNILISNKYDYI